MILLQCCDKMLKFPTWWDFIAHLINEHGYSKEAANDQVMEMLAWKTY
jgi:hypothetical protein